MSYTIETLATRIDRLVKDLANNESRLVSALNTLDERVKAVEESKKTQRLIFDLLDERVKAIEKAKKRSLLHRLIKINGDKDSIMVRIWYILMTFSILYIAGHMIWYLVGS